MTGACTINDDGTMIAIPHWNSNNNRRKYLYIIIQMVHGNKWAL